MAVARDRSSLFEALRRLSQVQCEAIATEIGMPQARWLPASAAPPDRALSILKFGERKSNGLEELGRAIDELARRAAAPQSTLSKLGSLPGQVIQKARDRGFEKRYAKYLADHFGAADTPGLFRPGAESVPLASVYVERKLIALPTSAEGTPLFDPPGTIQALLGALPKGVALCLCGPPGVGKSTLLRRLALTLPSEASGEANRRGIDCVLLLDLRDHLQDIGAGMPISRVAHRFYEDEARFPTLKPQPGFFDEQLVAGRCLVLLDGLDSLALSNWGPHVAGWIDTQVAHHPDCRFVVACHRRDDGLAPLKTGRIAELLPFTRDDVKRYARSWYEATVGRAGVLGRRELPSDAEHALNDFLQQIDASDKLVELAANPVFAPLLVLSHRYVGQLPTVPYQLIGTACDALLEWSEAGVGVLRLDEKRRALQHVAGWMMEHAVATLTRADLKALFAQALGWSHPDAVDPHLPALAQCGLLIGEVAEAVEGARWRFAHTAFIDYWCASRWIDVKAPGAEAASRAVDPRWHGALALYATEGDAQAVVEAALAGGDGPSLRLLGACADEAPSLPLAIRRFVSEQIDAALDSPEPTRRRATAESRLRRRLRRFESLDVAGTDARRIDPDHITNAEYQLFLDDLGPRASRHRPDHWLGSQCLRGAAAHLGLRRPDALAFCDWLSRKSADSNYRLPTAEEAAARWVDGDPIATYFVPSGAAWLGEDVESWALGILAREARFGVPPTPPTNLLRRPLCDETLASHDTIASHLESIFATVARAGVQPKPHASSTAGEASHALVELRRASMPDPLRRESVLEYLRLLSIALSVDRDEIPRGHWFTLRNHRHFDYVVLLDAVLALLLARDVPRFVAAMARREPFEAEMDVTLAALRPLSDAGVIARMLLERKRVGEAATELRNQMAQHPGAKEPALGRLGVYLTIRLDLLAAPQAETARLVTLWLGAQASALAADLAQRVEPTESRRMIGRVSKEDATRALLDVYWWAQLLIARSSGQLPAFEGIRLVREPITP